MTDQKGSTDMSDLADLYSALDSAHTVMALSSQDWSTSRDFAWLYGVVVGWSDDEGDSLPDLAARFGWSSDDVVLLKRLNAAVKAFDINRVAELSELPALFDLQWKRMGEATARWRAEDPEARALTMPDLGHLLKWLMDDADRARAEKRTTMPNITDDVRAGLVRIVTDKGVTLADVRDSTCDVAGYEPTQYETQQALVGLTAAGEATFAGGRYYHRDTNDTAAPKYDTAEAVDDALAAVKARFDHGDAPYDPDVLALIRAAETMRAKLYGGGDRDRLLSLAAEVMAAGSDDEALDIMRDATGLTMTDPAADRAEIDRRVREADKGTGS